MSAWYLWRPKVGWVGRRLEDVGRSALSSSIGQNVVAMLLFSTWALDLGRFFPDAGWSMAAGPASWVIVAVIITALAALYRRTLGQGPVEWPWARSYALLTRRTPSWGQPSKQAVAKAA